MHVDMDAFFASVEQLRYPQYRGKPVIVGALPGRRGVVSAASYEARKYGVHSAMPISTAYSLCPKGIFLPVDGKTYREVSSKIFSTLQAFSPLVEIASIDEAYLDITGCPVVRDGLHNAGVAVKKAIYDAVLLTASVGIAPNKFLAKIASDTQKPDGLTVVPAGEELVFLKPLTVEKLFGVGKKTVQFIHDRGITTVGQLQKYERDQLVAMFGSLGDSLYFYSRGQDSSEVCDEAPPKSIGKETTFQEYLQDAEYLQAVLAQLSEDVGIRLRRNSMYASRVTLKIRFDSFETITRSISFQTPVNQDHILYSYARELLDAVPLHKKVRLIGITASNLSEVSRQLELFETDLINTQKLYFSLDKIRSRFGEKSITLGASVVKNKKNKKKQDFESI